MQLIEIATTDLIEYENNPRKNEDAVQYVAESIRQFGFKVPCIVDRNNVLVAGHTRLKAAKFLGMEKVPCIVADDLSEEQIQAFRLADNKVSEFAEWDEELLAIELSEIVDIDMTDFGFSFDIDEDPEEDDKYTTEVNIPQYEITGDTPTIADMYNMEKTDELIAEIEQSEVTDEEKAFLIEAAKRHIVFNYRNIAEYYAQASIEMQRLMEKSALVIIDVNNAIADGYAKLKSDIDELMEENDA